METFNRIQFIEKLLLPDLKKMIDQDLHYYAFSVICQAIEVLGSVYDQESTDDFGMSRTRFGNALTNLFPNTRYRSQQGKFFEVLRGPLIHQLQPGSGFFISSARKDGINKENHLEIDAASGKIILVIEQFFDDFVTAFEKLKRELQKRKDLDHRKVEKPFITVGEINPPHPSSYWDKATQKQVVICNSNVTGKAIP